MSFETCDEFTHYGSSQDLEPPDPILICARCSKFMEDEMVKKGYIWTPWRHGRCHENAAKRLGWKYAHPRAAAWGEYRDPTKPLPEEWEWEKNK